VLNVEPVGLSDTEYDKASLSASVAEIVKNNVLFSSIILLLMVLSIGAWLEGEGSVHCEVLNVRQLLEHSNVPPVYLCVIHVWLLSFNVSHTSDIPSLLGDCMMLSPQYVQSAS